MPSPPPTSHPKVFISYSHDDADHRNRILGLAERLRTDGFDAMIDQYVEGTPLQGWARWMLNQIDWADYVLLVCTEIYWRRFRGFEAPDVGKGVDWEGAIITTTLYKEKSVSRRFVPVLLNRDGAQYIPDPLGSSTFYILRSEDGYKDLTDFLAGAAGVQPARLGPPPLRNRKTGTRFRFDGHDVRADAAPTANDRLSAPIHGLPAPGGTMCADDRFYIERDADRSAKAAAKLATDTIVVKGPHQFGKSSLLAHYVALCKAGGKVVASIDFSRFEKNILSEYSRLLTTLACNIAQRLRLACPSGQLRTQQEFLEFIETKLLPQVTEPLVLAFDETDRVMPHDYSQDFFSMVRMWHNDRAYPSVEWHKVGLALATSSEPKLYIKDPRRSPFNVGRQVDLRVFDVGDVVELNRRYGAPLSDDDCVRLHELVGGHPFLTQDAFYKIVGPDAISFERLCTEGARDDGPFGAHLRAMLSNVASVDGLLDALKQTLDHGNVNRRDDSYYRLAGAGLVCRDSSGRIVPTSEIYDVFFRGVL